MSSILMYVLLILGFILLIKGADYFVEGASSLAELLRIPGIIIGLTIVAMGTSLPEASVSITAALNGANELSLSNVVGSNIFNLLVVAGASALFRAMPIQKDVLRRDFPFSILATVVTLGICLLFPLVQGFALTGDDAGTLRRPEGVLLLVLFVIYLYLMVRSALNSRKNTSADEEEYDTLSPLRTAAYIILGIIAIIIGGNLVVNSASDIAASFGLSETLIGLTIVAVGTSLPELVTSMVAAHKGKCDLAMGNVIGSNIFNLLLVLGASCALHPIAVNFESVFDLIFLIIVSLLIWAFAWHKSEISKKEGIPMLLIYVGYLAYIIIR